MGFGSSGYIHIPARRARPQRALAARKRKRTPTGWMATRPMLATHSIPWHHACWLTMHALSPSAPLLAVADLKGLLAAGGAAGSLQGGTPKAASAGSELLKRLKETQVRGLGCFRLRCAVLLCAVLFWGWGCRVAPPNQYHRPGAAQTLRVLVTDDEQ